VGQNISSENCTELSQQLSEWRSSGSGGGSMRFETQLLQLESAAPTPADRRRMIMRLLTIVCLSGVILEIAIWTGLVAGWTSLARSSSGAPSTTPGRATEPRSALTSPPDLIDLDVAAAREEIGKIKEALRQPSVAERKESAGGIADLSAAREETQTTRTRDREAEKNVSEAMGKRVQERARAKTLDRGAARAREEIRMFSLQIEPASQSSGIEQELMQERARSEALDHNLAAARQEMKTRPTN
jgi:hypothetical protein